MPIIIYLVVLGALSIASWKTAGSLVASIHEREGFWPRLSALSALMIAPLVASLFALELQEKDAAELAHRMLGVMNTFILILTISRVVYLHSISKIAGLRKNPH